MVLKHLVVDVKETCDDLKANMAGKKIKSDHWIVDTGANEHMTGDTNLLINKVACSHEPLVTIPNGDLIPVKGKGSCSLPNGMSTKNVLYIPKFACNLLSVGKLTDDLNYAVTFFPDFLCCSGLKHEDLDWRG